jgi:hypothetical protein
MDFLVDQDNQDLRVWPETRVFRDSQEYQVKKVYR